MSHRIVIIGATSGIARPLCRRLARRGCQLLLAGRDDGQLQRIRTDLSIRYGGRVDTIGFQALAFETHAEFADRCFQHFDGDVTGLVFCVGFLAPQEATQVDFALARQTIDVNLTAAVSILHRFADRFEQRKSGWLAVISSVAGDRGRQSNYTYGAAKAGLTVFLQGLRQRLQPAGVHVLTVKPGPVDTTMSAGLFDPDSWRVASPDAVAAGIERAIFRRRHTVYLPGYWRWIMSAICALPERLFKRLRL